MGVSASASVFIGFLVKHDDFWSRTTQTSKQPECPNGHGSGIEGKYCSECGARITTQRRTVKVPTSRFKAFVDEYNKTATSKLSYEEVWDPDSQPVEEPDPDPFEGLELKCVDAKDHSEHDEENLALGESILTVHQICGAFVEGVNAVTLDEIKAKTAKIEKIRNALGIDRPVQVFLTSYCSY